MSGTRRSIAACLSGSPGSLAGLAASRRDGPQARLSPPLTVAILSFAIAACAPIEPQRPPEIRTTIVEVKTIVPVPCFTEAERPVLKPPSPIDIDHATVDQMAMAMAADDLNEQNFAREVDALFLKCMQRIADGTANQPVGAKP